MQKILKTYTVSYIYITVNGIPDNYIAFDDIN